MNNEDIDRQVPQPDPAWVYLSQWEASFEIYSKLLEIQNFLRSETAEESSQENDRFLVEQFSAIKDLCDSTLNNLPFDDTWSGNF